MAVSFWSIHCLAVLLFPYKSRPSLLEYVNYSPLSTSSSYPHEEHNGVGPLVLTTMDTSHMRSMHSTLTHLMDRRRKKGVKWRERTPHHTDTPSTHLQCWIQSYLQKHYTLIIKDSATVYIHSKCTLNAQLRMLSYITAIKVHMV